MMGTRIHILKQVQDFIWDKKLKLDKYIFRNQLHSYSVNSTDRSCSLKYSMKRNQHLTEIKE